MLSGGTFQLFGYDARRPLGGPTEKEWTTDRRKRFLLCPDIVRPLSVDRTVWPALPCALKDERELPEYWSELEDLRHRCSEAEFTLVAMAVEINEPRAQALLTSCTPSEVTSEWPLLGYDVADTGLTSGLSNCGFLPAVDDLSMLQQTWEVRLNAHGLFRAHEDATAFRDLSDSRLPEHAPFLVIALYEVVGF